MKTESGKGLVEKTAWALLCLFVFTIPWEKSIWVPGIGTCARLMGILAFALGVAAALLRHSPRRPNLVLLLAAAFVGWSALTYFWSYSPHATIKRVTTLAELWAMLWLVWESCRGEARQRHLMQAYVAGAVLGCAIAFARYAQHLQTYYRRYAAAGFDPNDFGLVVALSIPLAFALARGAGGWARWCHYGAVLVAILAVFLTASRTALAVTFVAFGFAAWTWKRADRVQRAATAVLLAVLLGGLLRFAPAPQRQRLATITTEATRGTMHGRTRIWKSGLKAFKARPLRGVGSGAYPEAVYPWLGRPGVAGAQYVAHNTFLSVLVETGFIGFGLYGLLLAGLAFFIWSMPPPERPLWTVMLLAWAVGVSTLTWEHYKPTWLIMALISTGWARACWRGGSCV